MRTHRSDTALAAVLVVCWSSGFVGATLGTGAAPVDTVLAWRTLLSAAVLLGVALLRGVRVSRNDMLRQGVVGLLVQVVYLGGVFSAAAAGVPAGTSALIAALQPLLVASVAGRLLGERTTRRQAIGLFVGALGVAIVVSGGIGSGTAAPLAYLLPVGAVIALASGTLLERRWRPTSSVIGSLTVQTTVAALVFGTTAASRGHLVPPADGRFWLATVWLVLLASFGGYGSYLLVVRRSGATRASSLLYLTPPTTTVWAWLLFHQLPQPIAVPGAVVCGVGLALALRVTTPAAAKPGAVTPPGTRPRAGSGRRRAPA